jgi:hypothetical protein
MLRTAEKTKQQKQLQTVLARFIKSKDITQNWYKYRVFQKRIVIIGLNGDQEALSVSHPNRKHECSDCPMTLKMIKGLTPVIQLL